MKFNNILNEALRNIPELPGEDEWGRKSAYIGSQVIEDNVDRIASLLEAQEGFGPDDVAIILEETDAVTIETGYSDMRAFEAFEWGADIVKNMEEDQAMYRYYRDNIIYYWVARGENEVITRINEQYKELQRIRQAT